MRVWLSLSVQLVLGSEEARHHHRSLDWMQGSGYLPGGEPHDRYLVQKEIRCVAISLKGISSECDGWRVNMFTWDQRFREKEL